MQVILKEDVEKLGRRGEVVDVRGGFFRNFLQPRGQAILFTERARKAAEAERGREDARRAKEKAEAQALAVRLTGLTLKWKVQVGEEGKLFGAVTSQEVAQALKEQGVEVDKRRIEMEPIKQAGMHTVNVMLHPEVKVALQVVVHG